MIWRKSFNLYRYDNSTYEASFSVGLHGVAEENVSKVKDIIWKTFECVARYVELTEIYSTATKLSVLHCLSTWTTWVMWHNQFPMKSVMWSDLSTSYCFLSVSTKIDRFGPAYNIACFSLTQCTWNMCSKKLGFLLGHGCIIRSI